MKLRLDIEYMLNCFYEETGICITQINCRVNWRPETNQKTPKVKIEDMRMSL